MMEHGLAHDKVGRVINDWNLYFARLRWTIHTFSWWILTLQGAIPIWLKSWHFEDFLYFLVFPTRLISCKQWTTIRIRNTNGCLWNCKINWTTSRMCRQSRKLFNVSLKPENLPSLQRTFWLGGNKPVFIRGIQPEWKLTSHWFLGLRFILIFWKKCKKCKFDSKLNWRLYLC